MRHLILGTAGHVDHGKTALIKALTQIDCDTHKEEKKRGITINLGFSHLELPTGDSLGIIDVPGHKDFIKTMVAGAFGIDLVLLVIAADSGIMPQTKEHLNIIETLGVKHGIIVLNKADLVDKEMLELAELEISDYLEGSVFESAPIVAVSSTKGTGLDKLLITIEEVSKNLNQRSAQGVFRLYIDRIFTVSGKGCVLTGSVLGGTLQSGSTAFLGPENDKQLRIRSMERHGQSVEVIYAGDRAALNVSGLKTEDFSRGMLLSKVPHDSTQMLDAQLSMFGDEIKIGTWSNVLFFTGTFECAAKMHLLDVEELSQGEKAFIQLHLDKPACMMSKDRFIIRNSSNTMTIGGGSILDPSPLHHRKRTPKLIHKLQLLAKAVLDSDHLFGIIDHELHKQNQPVFIEELAGKIGHNSDFLTNEIQEHNEGSIVMLVSDNKTILVSQEVHRKYGERITTIIRQHHEKYFLSEEGLEIKDLSGKTGLKNKDLSNLYLKAVTSQLTEAGILKKIEESYSLVSHQPRIDSKTKTQLESIKKVIKDAGYQTMVLADIEKQFVNKSLISKDQLKMYLQYLTNQGSIYFSEGEYIHQDHFQTVQRILLSELVKRGQGINEKDFRLLIDSSKSFVKAMTRLMISNNIVTQESYYIKITDVGRSQLG